MIVPMEHLTLLCVEGERRETLECLRALGCVHLEPAAGPDSPASRDEAARLNELDRAAAALAAARQGRTPPAGRPKDVCLKDLADGRLEAPLPEIPAAAGAREKAAAALALDRERRLALAAADTLEEEAARIAPFGPFDPALPGILAGQGIAVRLFKIPLKAEPPAPAAGLARMLGEDRQSRFGVMIGGDALPDGCEPVPPPAFPLPELTRLAGRARERARAAAGRLRGAADGLLPEIEAERALQGDRLAFARAADAMSARDAVAWISGWAPAPKAPAIRAAAAQRSWGLLLRPPAPGECPPTLLEPPRIFRPVIDLFRVLGIAPAYDEADVSVPFFCFFSIFFAMLVGDGGYGAVILLLTALARKKMPRAPRSPFILMTVFAIATIAWGALSNTWFGASPGSLDNPAARWLADPSYKHMMLLCFSLGVAHLAIARLWNAAALFPDTKFLAQLGWAGIVAFMYCMTCGVVGIFPVPRFAYWVFGISLALVFCFSLKKSELREHGIELGMMPLTIAGTLGDIISYVRLFAVGLASVKVAQNFNDMAIGLGLPVWAKIVPMLLILLVGHGLNFAMAALSILVHAVRLNTLEFSNHKGISWSGYAYKPFKKKAAGAA